VLHQAYSKLRIALAWLCRRENLLQVMAEGGQHLRTAEEVAHARRADADDRLDKLAARHLVEADLHRKCCSLCLNGLPPGQ
jgi:hypothetical protein